jgi:hypothetical protein
VLHPGLQQDASTSRILQDDNYDTRLLSLGIRRWKFQKILLDAVLRCDEISIRFNSKVILVGRERHTVDSGKESQKVLLSMQDGSTHRADILFAADGCRSCLRDQVIQRMYNSTGKIINCADGTRKVFCPNTSRSLHSSVSPTISSIPHLRYSGITCLMGISGSGVDVGGDCINHDNENEIDESNTQKMLDKGIVFLSSETTTGCHAIVFPTGPLEKCFQFYFPKQSICSATNTSWGTLTETLRKDECTALSHLLRNDGWDERYVDLLNNTQMALRIAGSVFEPDVGLEQYAFSLQDLEEIPSGVHGNKSEMKGTADTISATSEFILQRRVVLLGDAAHPPVPYTGQASQVGIEDAATIAHVLEHFCFLESGKFSLDRFDEAMSVYEKVRIPRVGSMVENSRAYGHQQQLRASHSDIRRRYCEEQIKRDLFFHETSPNVLTGVQYDYESALNKELSKYNS